MKTSSFGTIAVLAATLSLAFAASNQPSCGAGSLCPESAPCCSQYGECGVGAYCLGGCDPAYSFSLESCVAAAVCESSNYKLNSLNGVTPNTQYLGDASSTNWVSSGNPAVYQEGNSVLLTMAQNTVGTLLMSTHYVWYGKISATMTTSQGQGVVTAFIMMSDIKDEIDFEFVGTDINHAQSNYYWQGVTDYDNEVNLTVSNTVSSHTYEFDWTPDYITWSIDGTPLRTLNKNSTYNTTDNKYHFPQTPARIELSLWPAGLPTNGQGTIDWAGGIIDWNSPYMQQGYYFAQVSDVNVECYQPPSGFSNNFGNSAYYYNSRAGTNDTVCIGGNSTELASFFASGDNPSYNPNAKASGTATSSAPVNTASVETVPGVSSGGGHAGGDVNDGSSGSSGSGSSSNNNPSGTASSSGSQQTSFVQGTSDTSQAPPRVAAGSAVALLGFFIAALML